MSTLTWITEKELEQVIKNKGDEFRWKKNENFIAAVSKWETLAASKVKMSGSEKNKSEQEHKQQKFWWTHTTILILHSRDKAVMLGINTIEFFLVRREKWPLFWGTFTYSRWKLLGLSYRLLLF